MSTVLFLAALALLCTAIAVLLAATGGRALVHADHPLPEPARHARRAPKEDR
ncbi:hypothetical protein [Nocardiopsis sp. TNDT3]|uniref:hypothetical protein n=1 Tax=Nocardiopsis sp. TNDT3 TaxID=2249354 RepID=UPI0013002225|nr:hypothetical protein [Nocardiopsis sp. TNDT3]